MSPGSLKLRLTLETKPWSEKLHWTMWDPDDLTPPAIYCTAQIAIACPQATYRLYLWLNWGGLQGVL